MVTHFCRLRGRADEEHHKLKQSVKRVENRVLEWGVWWGDGLLSWIIAQRRERISDLKWPNNTFLALFSHKASKEITFSPPYSFLSCFFYSVLSLLLHTHTPINTLVKVFFFSVIHLNILAICWKCNAGLGR